MAAFLIAGVAAPRGVTVIDEVDYLTEAQALAGRRDLRDLRAYLPRNGGGRWEGPRYPLGWPLVLALATPSGPGRRASPDLFWPSLLLHLLGAAVLAEVLRRRGLSRRWALLYLAQPSLLLFSGTLMAEPLAGLHTALLLLACDASPVLLGVVAGFAPWVKLSQVIVAAPFVLARCRSPRALSLAALGAALPLAGFVALDFYLYGAPLGPGRPGYAGPLAALGWGGLELAQLAVAWPLLPLAALAARREELVAAACAVVYFAFYDSARYAGANLPMTLVVGARLLVPAIVLLLPGYAALLSKRPRAAFAALSAVAIAAPLVLFPALARRRRELDTQREALLAGLRPGCSYRYAQDEVRKLLVPWPANAALVSELDAQPPGCVLPLPNPGTSTNRFMPAPAASATAPSR